jgi:hypothetical protein
MVVGETDSATDIFERSGGNTTQISTGSLGGNGAQAAFFGGSSQNGARVFFETTEKLESDDGETSSRDVYERYSGQTTVISIGPSGGTGAFDAFHDGNSQDGTRAFFDTREPLMESDTSIDVYVAIVGTYQSPTGGTPFRVPIVPAFRQCTTPTPGQLHGGGLPVKTGCSNPQLASTTVTVGTSNTLGTRVANARMDVCGDTAAPGCTQLTASQVPDVRLRGNSSDVVCQTGAPLAACPGGAGSDYDPNPGAGPYLSRLDPGTDSNAVYPSTSATTQGIPCHPSPPNPSSCAAGADMTAVAAIPSNNKAIRVTDSWNSTPSKSDDPNCGATTSCAATVVDQAFPVPVVCKANGASNGIGSYCGVNTTANALFPGTVEGGKFAVVEVGEIQVFDSGPDGIRGNANDELIGVQGIFIP